ncbi:Uncharacterized protein Fot_42487 [Forsythia ovata]|uniref:Uncharacterized protein n=1 Tax=Forsythia ovata TaxID=205694 RepID=A0ABD1RLB6_9LAMI
MENSDMIKNPSNSKLDSMDSHPTKYSKSKSSFAIKHMPQTWKTGAYILKEVHRSVTTSKSLASFAATPFSLSKRPWLEEGGTSGAAEGTGGGRDGMDGIVVCRDCIGDRGCR